ncbi:hypothetical protein IFR04_007938 [Cadophora malorum]|uniref:ASX DEUBAD domain-containing protein n=1 Tax=Cadophora malorum TaxID=108018 RepID=A0A8H7W863_9HELO|nr:hypothetical protein IFR04_007938 [Cadophora malorum]
MSTNGGPPGGAPNGLNGLPSSHRLTTGFYDISIEGSAGDSDGVEGVAPPSRPSSPESGTTPRVLLGPRVAEATSRQDLLRSIPTAQPPFFGSITAYTHAPLPPRGGLHPGASNGASGANGHATNGLTPSSPLARSSRYLTVPGQNGSIVSTLQGLHISSCSDDMLIPTPHNTPAATPRTSPTAPGRETGRRVASNSPITPPPPTGHPRNTRTCPNSPYPGMVYGENSRIPRSPHSDTSSTDTVSGLQAPHNTPVTPSVSPQRSPTSSDGRVETARLPRRHGPAFFGSPLNPTRQRGGGPKKKQKGKMTNGKLPNGKTKGKGKGTAKDKMLDDTALAVAHGESPIYTSNIVAILQHPEALAVLSSAPDIDPTALTTLLATSGFKDVLAAFVETGKAGQNDPDWLEEALAASSRRGKGEFDEVLEENFREIWEEEGEKMADEEGA